MSRPIRSSAILLLVAVGTGLAAAGGWRYARASAPVNGPIILISIDSLRPDRLSAYGFAAVPTPTIDMLAADGVVFERAYSHVPQTLPAHASLLSGRLPFDTLVRDASGPGLQPSERMLAEILRDRGFSTGAVVSSWLLRGDTGLGQGFDLFDDAMAAPPGGTLLDELRRDGADSIASAEQWLESYGGSRAFLFVQLAEPHTPYDPPERFAGFPAYDGAVAYADELVGRFVRYLKAHQLYDRSTIVLVSDHGEGLGDHGEYGHGLLAYEETLRVPLIVKLPAGEGAGRRVKDLVQHVDVAPTILDLAKAPIPGAMRGRTLRPLLEGGGRFPRRTVYSESLYAHHHFGWSARMTITDGRYRYIGPDEEELYDLDSDPSGRTNLAETEPSRAASLRDQLTELVDGARSELPAVAAAPQEVRERLEALGYVGEEYDTRRLVATTSHEVEGPRDRDSSGGSRSADIAGRGTTARNSGADVEFVEQYRGAISLSVSRRWFEAIDALRRLVGREPGRPDLWIRLAEAAAHAGRHDLSIDAYHRAADLGAGPEAALGAAAGLFELRRLDAARTEAERAVKLASAEDRGSRGSAHELLARVALMQYDEVGAREEAARAEEAEPGRPMLAYIDGRVAYDRGLNEAAVGAFEAAIARRREPSGRAVSDLHFHLGKSLQSLDRADEAEYHFLEELKSFPRSVTARLALVALYRTYGRSEEAGGVLEDLVRAVPTPETYAAAARLWIELGNRQKAAMLHTEATRMFPPRPRPTQRASLQ